MNKEESVTTKIIKAFSNESILPQRSQKHNAQLSQQSLIDLVSKKLLELEFRKQLNKNKVVKICDQKNVANNIKWAIKKLKEKEYCLVCKKKRLIMNLSKGKSYIIKRFCKDQDVLSVIQKN